MQTWASSAARRLVVATVLATTCCATLAAAAPAAGAPSDSAGITNTEIRLGMSAAFTGHSRSLGIELYRGSMAFFSDINASGGVHGRRIVVRAYDDEYEPDLAINNTMRLMRIDNVFALFNYVGTPTMNRVLPLLRKNEHRHFLLLFPFTGADTNRVPPYDRFSLNLRASYAQETQALVDRLVAIGRQRIAILYQSDAFGRSGWAGVRAALARHGLQLAGEATYRRATPFSESFDRQVALMENAKPDAIICIGTYEACGGFIRDARDRSLDVPVGTVSFVGSESMMELLVRAGRASGRDYTASVVGAQVVPSPEDESLPVVREYRQSMSRHGDALMPPESLLYPRGQDAADAYTALPYGLTSLEGYMNAKLIVDILLRLGPTPDRMALEHLAPQMRDIDLGLGFALSFGGEHHPRQASDAVYFTAFRGKRLVPFGDDDWKVWAKP